jgi:hypothetical protein
MARIIDHLFAEGRANGQPLDEAHARTRLQWEPVTEVTEIKGDSETHPVLSAVEESSVAGKSQHDAFRRKEVCASTGPRIALWFFGGFDFSKSDLKAHDIAATGYRKGVPVGVTRAARTADEPRASWWSR